MKYKCTIEKGILHTLDNLQVGKKATKCLKMSLGFDGT